MLRGSSSSFFVLVTVVVLAAAPALLSLPVPATTQEQRLPEAVEAALLAHQATIARLEAKAVEQQTALNELQTETQRLEAALHQRANSRGSWTPSLQQQPRHRRGLATCNATASSSSSSPEPRLLVEGACSCTEDVVVAGRSVVDQFDQFNASMHLLQQQQQKTNCAQRVGKFVGLQLKGTLKDSSNMDAVYGLALDVDAGLAYVAAYNSAALPSWMWARTRPIRRCWACSKTPVTWTVPQPWR